MSKEIRIHKNTMIVSETDEKGIIIYANDDFCNIAGYSKEELIGKPHNLVRHEDMPKVAFEDLWKTINRGEVWQGFVKNKTKSGGFYWVFATVYPYKNESGQQCFMSVRKKPSRENVEKYGNLYKTMM